MLVKHEIRLKGEYKHVEREVARPNIKERVRYMLISIAQVPEVVTKDDSINKLGTKQNTAA